jgi:hypothetical protein
MSDDLISEVSPVVAGVAEESEIQPRLTIILHPNPSCVDIVVNDRMFNKERYSFSRKEEPVGAEKILLDYCQEHIIGIHTAEANKSTLKLKLEDGILLREFIPQLVTAVKRWGSEVEPYNPMICVVNRRWKVEAVYDDDMMRTNNPGVRELPNDADLGIPYTTWVSLH